MHIIVAVGVDQDNDLTIQESERHHSLFTVILPRVFTGDSEVVPDGLGALEVQAMKLYVPAALRLVPGGHQLIVFTICSDWQV